jgi:hypothetical protein
MKGWASFVLIGRTGQAIRSHLRSTMQNSKRQTWFLSRGHPLQDKRENESFQSWLYIPWTGIWNGPHSAICAGAFVVDWWIDGPWLLIHLLPSSEIGLDIFLGEKWLYTKKFINFEFESSTQSWLPPTDYTSLIWWSPTYLWSFWCYCISSSYNRLVLIQSEVDADLR